MLADRCKSQVVWIDCLALQVVACLRGTCNTKLWTDTLLQSFISGRRSECIVSVEGNAVVDEVLTGDKVIYSHETAHISSENTAASCKCQVPFWVSLVRIQHKVPILYVQFRALSWSVAKELGQTRLLPCGCPVSVEPFRHYGFELLLARDLAVWQVLFLELILELCGRDFLPWADWSRD